MKPLLDLIARAESEGAVDRQAVASAYDVVWGGIPVSDRPHALFRKGLSEMTVAEVLAWQDDIVSRGAKSSAAGRYQVIRKTLRGLVQSNVIGMERRFDASGQDACAMALLRGRGLDKWRAGKMDDATFANALAREWASFPVIGGPNHGRSFYAGDGLNKAGVTPDRVMAALAASRGVSPVKVEPAAKPIGGFWAALARLFGSIFGGK